MVFFALTRQGVEGFRQLSPSGGAPLWVSGGILTLEELSELRERGFNVTNFSSEIYPEDQDAVADAISTIKEHHPNELLWVEG